MLTLRKPVYAILVFAVNNKSTNNFGGVAAIIDKL